MTSQFAATCKQTARLVERASDGTLGESGEALFALGVTFIGQCDRDAALRL